jgi:hypothetical protein
MTKDVRNTVSSDGKERLVAVAVIIIIIAVIIIGLVFWQSSQGTPTLEVSNVSLSPNEIKVGDFATFTFTIKNNDAAKPHSMKLVFNTTSPVIFYQNNVSLLVGNNGFQYLPITLQSSEQSTYPLKVTGTLTAGASTSTYSIRIEFYDENSTKFDTETQSLKIGS